MYIFKIFKNLQTAPRECQSLSFKKGQKSSKKRIQVRRTIISTQSGGKDIKIRFKQEVYNWNINISGREQAAEIFLKSIG